MRKRWAGDQTHGSQILSNLRGGSGGTTGRPLPCATLRCGSNQWRSFYNLPWVDINLHICASAPKRARHWRAGLSSTLAFFFSRTFYIAQGLVGAVLLGSFQACAIYMPAAPDVQRNRAKSKPLLFRGGLGRGLNIRNASPKVRSGQLACPDGSPVLGRKQLYTKRNTTCP